MTQRKTAKAKEIAVEIQRLAESMKRLRALGVIRSQKTVGDIGEWIAAALFDGCIAEYKNQKGWDVVCATGNMQVRTHAKAEDNRTQWTSIRDLPDDCSELAIIVLTHAFEIHRAFRVPIQEAQSLARNHKLSWSRIVHREVRLSELPAAKALAPLFAQPSNNAFKGRRAKRARP